MIIKKVNEEQIEPVSAKKVQKRWILRLKSAVSYLLLLLVLGWGVDFWRAQSLASGRAPELVASSVQGESIDILLMSQEKPVLVYFWATWCSVCRAVSPSVDWFSDNYQVVTIALSSGEDKRIRHYLNAKEYQFTVINDAKGTVARDWGISLTPTIFIIDKGEITSVTTGFTSPLGIWARLLL